MLDGRPHVLVLGGNLGGLTAARFIRERCGDAVRMTLVDRKPYTLFVPNIPLEVLGNADPAESLHLQTPGILEHDDITFVQADVLEIDLDRKKVTYVPSERPGAAPDSVEYDYLVLALGARLAYDKIDGFAEHGHTVSDCYYGNRLRRYLHDDYQGGPIAIGSARFHQGTTGKPSWLPDSKSSCEGVPLEVAVGLATWLQDHNLGGPKTITLFTPAEVIAEDAGEEIVKEFMAWAGELGYGYKNKTEDVKRVTANGIEFANGESVEAELKIVLPDWEAHEIIASLPITDESGFVITGTDMRNPDRPEVFAVGDCAAITVPKLGALGHTQAEVVSRQLAVQVGKLDKDQAGKEFWPEIICMGDMGHHRAFYIHSDTWYGGKISVFKMGYTYYALKIAFKEMYFRTGGKPPSWGLPLTELVAEKLV